MYVDYILLFFLTHVAAIGAGVAAAVTAGAAVGGTAVTGFCGNISVFHVVVVDFEGA